MNNHINNAIKHFKTITHHKLLVMEGCFRLGLYKQGLLHDLSKYTPEEFITGVRYYQGTRSPNTAEVEGKENNLLELIAADDEFPMGLEELQAAMEPSRYVGRSPRQVEVYLRDVRRQSGGL